jgi:hypothetical protein
MVSVEVEFPSGRMPTPQEWQDSILAHGFAVSLDREFDPLAHSGFLPARCQNQPAGFEYYIDVVAEANSRVTFAWGGDADEGISAVVAAGCLAYLTGGDLTDPQSGEVFPAIQAIQWAREMEAELSTMAWEQSAASEASAPKTSKRWWRFW